MRKDKIRKRIEEKAIRRGIMLDEVRCIERFIKWLERIDDQG